VAAEDIRAMRDAAQASQAVFAHYLNVSTKLVQSWEGGRRTPDGPALRLLELARREPRLVFGGLIDTAPAPKSRKSRAVAKKSSAKKPTSRPKR
jgi:transcriptional regulator with XRE-family HTH domain